MGTATPCDAVELGETMSGVLYGVGLGPGDPDLMTLKTARLIANADAIAFPSLVGGESLARSIAADVIAENAIEILVEVPMTTDREPAQAAYDKGAAEISGHLADGRNVIYLCEGDPFFYGSFMYIFARLSGKFDVEVVPGVTSVTACAATAGMPLVARNERMTVLPGPLPETELRARIEGAETVAIMKVGRHLAKIRSVIEDLGLLDQAVYVERASRPEERVLSLARAPENAPYFSMILLAKGADPWL